MRLDEFRALIDRLAADVPTDFRSGVVAVTVSPATVPHPLRGDVYTLGECIPLEWSGSGADLQSRIVLYHGSFAALAGQGQGAAGFDWRREAWETLSHELRHHLEWRANVNALEAYDWATEQNYARTDGALFDPAFYRSGERVARDVYKVEDDVFIEWRGGPIARARGTPIPFTWHGRQYRVRIPSDAQAPMFLTLEGLAEPPPSEAILVMPARWSLLDFFRRRPVAQRAAAVESLDD